MKDLLKSKWVKFGIVATLYLLWVIWNTNYWWLFGLPVIFDMYITKRVHWAFWKKKGVEKQTKVVEWVDAIIFAVIAATFIRTFFSSVHHTYLIDGKIVAGWRLPFRKQIHIRSP
jgi:signal peptidase I